MKIPFCLLIGWCGVMRLKINLCLVRKGPRGGELEMFFVLECVKHGLLLSWNTLLSARTIVYVLPPQNSLIKRQRSCGQVVKTVCSWFILYTVRPFEWLPVALFIRALLCGDRPQCFLHCHSLIGKHTSHIDTRNNNKPMCTHSHTHWIMQPKIKALQTPQAHNEMGLIVTETWHATSAFQCLGLKAKSSRFTEL